MNCQNPLRRDFWLAAAVPPPLALFRIILAAVGDQSELFHNRRRRQPGRHHVLLVDVYRPRRVLECRCVAPRRAPRIGARVWVASSPAADHRSVLRNGEAEGSSGLAKWGGNLSNAAARRFRASFRRLVGRASESVRPRNPSHSPHAIPLPLLPL